MLATFYCEITRLFFFGAHAEPNLTASSRYGSVYRDGKERDVTASHDGTVTGTVNCTTIIYRKITRSRVAKSPISTYSVYSAVKEMKRSGKGKKNAELLIPQSHTFTSMKNGITNPQPINLLHNRGTPSNLLRLIDERSSGANQTNR